jgi:hypothetical protein
MSEVRLNILDSTGAINGTLHGGVADAVVAALSAEPETIAELEAALDRFIKPLHDQNPFALFHAGTNEEAWDAGIVIVDLAARIVAAESSYSAPQARGEVRYHDGSQSTEAWLPYRVPDDWLFVSSVDEYNGCCDEHRRRRAEPPLDPRPVLYGAALTEFIVKGCLAASDAKAEDPVARIHESWLMTPRADLHSQSPRDVMLARLDFIDFDLHTRQWQWSVLGEGPPPLARDSFAYLFAGFGTHECVVYYDLVRRLLSRCWERVQVPDRIEAATEMARLEEIKTAWLDERQRDFDGRIPSAIIESERRRIPLVMSAKDMIVDENCELCQMLGEESVVGLGPGFWHLDGCNMDEGFAFSFHRTREEWDEEERRRKQFNEEFDRDWAAHGDQHSPDEMMFLADGYVGDADGE